MSRDRLAAAAGTTSGRLALLAAVVAVVWLVSVAIATVIGAFGDFGEAAWSGLRHLLDPGSLGDDAGAGERIVGVIQVLAGLVFLVGVLFTVLSDLVDRGLTRLSEVRPLVRAEGHLIVIGAGAEELIGAFGADLAAAGVEELVTLLPHGTEERRPGGLPAPITFQARFGDPRDLGTLADLSATTARAIVVLSPPEPDPKVADLAALEITSAIAADLEGAERRPPVAIEIRRWPHVADLWGGFPAEFDPVLQDRGAGGLLALAVANPAFAAELTAAGTEPDETLPFVVPAGELTGRTFGEALAAHSGGLPAGLIRGLEVAYAPPANEVIRGEDGVVVLAASAAGAARRRPRPLETEEPPSSLPLDRVATPRLLVLGWSDVGRSLFVELGDAIRSAVLFSGPSPPGAPDHSSEVADLDDLDLLREALATHSPDAVVVLAGANGADDSSTEHAHAALIALHLSAATDRRLPIIVEQQSVDRAQRLRAADPRIAVLSAGELSARALLLSALDRPRQLATEALGADPALRIETVRFTGPEAIPLLPTASRALLEQGMVAFAIRREGELAELGDLAGVSLQPGDQLLVVERVRTGSRDNRADVPRGRRAT